MRQRALVVVLLLNASFLAILTLQEARLSLPRAEAGIENALPPCQDINGDGQANVTDAVSLLNWLFLGGPEPTCPGQNGRPVGLPDTGQAKCYDQGGSEIACDNITCPGQDGSYRTGCPSEGRFADNGDGTVTDSCTGLMWQKDRADTNGDGQLNEQDFLAWCQALEYCEKLSFAGHDEWRLPNVRELQGIVDYGRRDSALDPVFDQFSGPYTFWSSTSLTLSPSHAWRVFFADGFVGWGDKSINAFYVRAVRSGP